MNRLYHELETDRNNMCRLYAVLKLNCMLVYLGRTEAIRHSMVPLIYLLAL